MEDVDLSDLAEVCHLASVSLGTVGHTWEVCAAGQCTHTLFVRHALPHSEGSKLGIGRPGTQS